MSIKNGGEQKTVFTNLTNETSYPWSIHRTPFTLSVDTANRTEIILRPVRRGRDNSLLDDTYLDQPFSLDLMQLPHFLV